MSTAPKTTTVVQILELVAQVHRAKLSDLTLGTAKQIALAAGATRPQLQQAVARGLQAVLVCVLCTRCTPAPSSVVTPSDSAIAIETITLQPGMTLPGLRHVGMSQGAELWSDGDLYVRVRRIR